MNKALLPFLNGNISHKRSPKSARGGPLDEFPAKMEIWFLPYLGEGATIFVAPANCFIAHRIEIAQLAISRGAVS